MEWRSEYETSRAVLYRIVATLVALADLADWAERMPAPARWLVVYILRKAEGVAREFVLGSSGNDAAMDATDLARTFRRLALALRNTLRQLRRALNCWTFRAAASTCQGHRHLPALFAIGPAFAVPYPDTS